MSSTTSTSRPVVKKPQVINLKKQTQKEIASLYASVCPDDTDRTKISSSQPAESNQQPKSSSKRIPGIGRRLGSTPSEVIPKPRVRAKSTPVRRPENRVTSMKNKIVQKRTKEHWLQWDDQMKAKQQQPPETDSATTTR